MYNELICAGIRPIIHQLDNKCSQEMITVIKANGTKYQLAPPGDHRTNPAERAVQTFHLHPIWRGLKISSKPMGQANHPSGDDTQHATTIKDQPQTISIQSNLGQL